MGIQLFLDITSTICRRMDLIVMIHMLSAMAQICLMLSRKTPR